ncbi:lysine--tRNA ligase [Acidaminococcus sp. AM05-11]|uniref:lysine--tRNA ligase n=1 Tax=Acidaminococcus sp. AM05-11 TaxID=2291997 RepID=UPI000E529918|nr:lysine--tRNA ligase [Acidaminococcus sp. AM05-11]
MSEEKISPTDAKEGLGEEELNEQMAVRLEKARKLEEKGILPFGHAYEVTHHTKEVHDQVEAMEAAGTVVKVAGRLMAIRGHGKTCFMDLQDKTGKIQLYVRKDEMGEDAYSVVKLLDIGDIVGVEGVVFKTHMGEPSIRVQKLEFLSKALKPLPEKWHGLKDKEIRYRQRYVDLIVNPEVREVFIKRTQIIKSIRHILDDEGYLEVETPVLNTISGGATARPFVTHHNALDIDLYLRIATELNLKRLIVGGMERVYELGRVFRNEGMDIKHNPEFTTLELYQAYGDFNTMMDITEKLVSETAQRVLGTMKISYEGTEIDLTPPWPRMTMIEAVKKYSGKDFTGVKDVEEARKMAKEANVAFEPAWGVGKILNAFFDAYVEKELVQPVFITGHPKEISPLAKSSQADPEITDRFEGFIYGRELCNGFTELNDPIDQRERFEKQVEERAAGDDEAGMMDEDFINALMHGLPPTGGLGIGIDRLVMFLTGAVSIRDVLLFPTMRPLEAQKADNKAAEVPAAAREKVVEVQSAAVPVEIDFSKVTIEPLFEDQVEFDNFAACDFRAVKVKDCFAVPKSKKLLQFTLDDGTGTDRTILSGIHAFYEPEDLIGKTCIAIINLPPRKMMGVESCGMLLSAEYHEGEDRKLQLLQVDPHIPAGAKLC